MGSNPTEPAEDVTNQKRLPLFWRKLQSGIMVTAALMISAGQWNDTTEVFSNLYQTTMANFTHQIEYDLIEKINVGNSFDYVKASLGEPYVVKRSRINKDVRFHYYTQDKFDLTLMINDDRVIGYSVYVKEADFVPQIPFAEKLSSKSLSSLPEKSQQYSYDVGNLTYYIEATELGKQQMFMRQVRGYLEYAAVNDSINNEVDYRKKIAVLIEKIDQVETFSEDETELTKAIQALRTQLYPNFFAITELDTQIIAESLLTRYEYQMFTKS
ncbi:ETEC_3214 domain-containing protein [Algibacillus agarilyticus]|uniref:ETEC_3214 domain-containing protein n=1 Tax=Algibacillus agarilyticus TaxID=2234133 RepID=UPI000DD01BD2|nr:ETEC_3214 domain-containing protein [Algibacillus agarilyticus]